MLCAWISETDPSTNYFIVTHMEGNSMIDRLFKGRGKGQWIYQFHGPYHDSTAVCLSWYRPPPHISDSYMICIEDQNLISCCGLNKQIPTKDCQQPEQYLWLKHEVWKIFSLENFTGYINGAPLPQYRRLHCTANYGPEAQNPIYAPTWIKGPGNILWLKSNWTGTLPLGILQDILMVPTT